MVTSFKLCKRPILTRHRRAVVPKCVTLDLRDVDTTAPGTVMLGTTTTSTTSVPSTVKEPVRNMGTSVQGVSSCSVQTKFQSRLNFSLSIYDMVSLFEACHEECPKCNVEMDTLLSCGHRKTLFCYIDVTAYDCTLMVIKILPCGHEHGTKCHKDPTEVACQEKVIKDLPCHHEIEDNCCKNVDDIECTVKMNVVIPACGHKVRPNLLRILLPNLILSVHPLLNSSWNTLSPKRSNEHLDLCHGL